MSTLRRLGSRGGAATVSGLSFRARGVLRCMAALGVLAVALHLAHGQLGLGRGPLNSFFDDWVYNFVMAGAAAASLARGLLISEERAAWLALGAGMSSFAIGEIYYSLAFGESAAPIPSLADLFYLLYYPAVYGGLIMLARSRIKRLSHSTWLDGAIAATTTAAVIAAVMFEPIARSASHGDPAAVATNFAYPVGDLILLGIVVAIAALSGWRPGKSWLLLGLGLALMAVADIGYLYESANGTYVVGGILDSLWLTAALVTACAAWRPPSATRAITLRGRRLLVLPGVFALAALGVLLWGSIDHVGVTGLALAAIAVLLVFLRGAWSFHDNLRLLEASECDARTDALTGLGNRRAMASTLDYFLESEADHATASLTMFDLNGFKAYNDRFGHVAGDALLAHLGRLLNEAVGAAGSAFRLGGDEFCVLIRRTREQSEPYIEAAVRALCAEGEGFSVTTSFGSVQLPEEARTSVVALRIADDRMYAQKATGRTSARQQSHDVLLEVMRERQPEVHNHLREVGRLAMVVGQRLGMTSEQLDELHRAAELHDVGKAAVPDAILHKPGPLDDHEWTLMRRHTLVGERILGVAPALIPVALIVRYSHERWDGTGYPDGISGDAIPLGSRIVSVCDAFDAMTSDRPYAPAITPEDALEELTASAGTQFDRDVVAAFESAWYEHVASLERQEPEKPAAIAETG